MRTGPVAAGVKRSQVELSSPAGDHSPWSSAPLRHRAGRYAPLDRKTAVDVDAKKKEKVSNAKNGRREWRPAATPSG
jgi:hypothetical protein